MKIASEKEIHQLKNFNNIPVKEGVDLYMVVKDGENLLGYAAVTLPSNEFAVIEELYILPSERGMGLGDGLLRATFNAIDLKGIQWVIINSHEELIGFLEQEELQLLAKVEIPQELISVLENWNKDYSIKGYYYCQPKEFFSRKCKGIKKMRR